MSALLYKRKGQSQGGVVTKLKEILQHLEKNQIKIFFLNQFHTYLMVFKKTLLNVFLG